MSADGSAPTSPAPTPVLRVPTPEALREQIKREIARTGESAEAFALKAMQNELRPLTSVVARCKAQISDRLAAALVIKSLSVFAKP